MEARTALREKRGAMPPWYIEKNVGIQRFKDDFSLSEDEIAIAAWADTGAPQGNPADPPPPLTFPTGKSWRIRTRSDRCLASVEMKAQAPDWLGSNRASPAGLTEDRYVAAVEVKEVSDLGGQSGRTNTVGGLYLFHHAAYAALAWADGGGPGSSGTESGETPMSSTPKPAGSARYIDACSTRCTCTPTASIRSRTSRSASSSTRAATSRR